MAHHSNLCTNLASGSDHSKVVRLGRLWKQKALLLFFLLNFVKNKESAINLSPTYIAHLTINSIILKIIPIPPKEKVADRVQKRLYLTGMQEAV